MFDRNDNHKDLRNYRARYGQFAHDPNSDVVPRRWKRESKDHFSKLFDSTMDGMAAAKLAERFRQSFIASSRLGVGRVKREAVQPLDHVVAIMEDIKKEMHSLEVK